MARPPVAMTAGGALKLGGDAPDQPVDLAGHAVDHAALQRLDGGLADGRARLDELHLAQLGRPGGERVQRDLDAGRQRAAEELARSLTTSKLVDVPKSTTMHGPP